MAQQAAPTPTYAPNPVGGFSVTPVGTINLVAGVEQDVESLLTQALRNLQGDIQSVWLDASAATAPVIARAQSSRQYAVWPPGSIGWQPLTIAQPARLQLFSTDAVANLGVAVGSGIVAQSPFNAGLLKARGGVNATPSVFSALSTPQTLSDQSGLRSGCSITNASPSPLYCLEGTNGSLVSTTNASVIVPAGGFFETAFDTGCVITGIWPVGATGGAFVTEFF